MDPEIQRCLDEIARCQAEMAKPHSRSEHEGAILGVLDWGLEILLIRGEIATRTRPSSVRVQSEPGSE